MSQRGTAVRSAKSMCWVVVLGAWLVAAAPARAWELFRSESSDVAHGNEALAKGQNKEALEAYDRAARALPDDPGVQLNRGLALLANDKLGEAREAFRRAASGNAPKELRAAALYNMGLTFLKDGEQAAKAEDLDGAKKQFEEAVDAFKGSLRAQPDNRDAAWNLELAKRRLVDTKQKQDEKKKQEEEKKKQEEQNKDQQNKDQQDQDQQDKQQGDAGSDKPEPRSTDAGTPEADGGAQAQPEDGQNQGDAGTPPPEPRDAATPAPAPAPQPEPTKQLPEHMERALDALEAGEQNLEKQRALQRARARPRRIEKDW